MARDLGTWRRSREIDLAVVQSFGAFSPGGRFLASADTNTIEVRDARTGLISATMEMAAVTSLAISPDGTILVAADDEGSINAWSLPPASVLWQARLALPAPAFAQVVFDVQFAHTGLAVVSKPGGVNNTIVEFWPLDGAAYRKPEALWQNVMLNSDYQAFSPSPDGDRVMLATHEGYWVLTGSGDRLFVDEYFGSGEHAVVAFSTSGHLAVGVEPEGAWIYNAGAHALREIESVDALTEPTDVAWSDNDELILITSEDGLSLCAADGDAFTWLGLIDDTPGFEAAAFVDEATIAAKRGDVLLIFSREG